MQPLIRSVIHSDKLAILAINQESLGAVSEIDDAYYNVLTAKNSIFRVVEVEKKVVGYVCALTREAVYDGEEFLWFQNHIIGDFLYIDQVAILKSFRCRGFAKRLYSDLEEFSRQNNITALACEVNHRPFNTESQRFHSRLGFSEIGRMPTRDMEVSLLVKYISSVSSAIP